MDKDDGLLTNDELEAFEDDLYHKNLRTAINENFVNHLCETNTQCFETMNDPLNLQDYDITKLIYKKTHPFDNIIGTLRDYTLEICLVTLVVQSTLFLLTIVDLLLGNNPNNSIRLMAYYIVRLFRALILLCYPSWQQNNTDQPEEIEMAPLRRRQSLL